MISQVFSKRVNKHAAVNVCNRVCFISLHLKLKKKLHKKAISNALAWSGVNPSKVIAGFVSTK